MDNVLINRVKAGDEDAAELLIRRYYPSILRYCRWHCPNMETAEDLTQETFIRLFRHLDEYKNRGTFKAYLYTIANHLCIDESRKISFSTTRQHPRRRMAPYTGSRRGIRYDIS